MIIGVGVDIVDVPRMERICKTNRRFVERVFTRHELDYSLPKKGCYQHLAARFAAKEALFKATQVRFRWQDVQIENDENGKPFYTFAEALKSRFEGCNLTLTISHTKEYAVALAVYEGLS